MRNHDDGGKWTGEMGAMGADRRVLFLQHQDDCGPGYLGDRAEELGFTIDVAHLAHGDRPEDPRGYAMVVTLGSDDSVLDGTVAHREHERAFLGAAIASDVPVLGVCYGAQMLATVLGGRVRPLDHPEIGWLTVDTTDPDLIEPGPWLVWHLDELECPPGADLLGRTDGAVQAFRQGPHLGVQFHPEATPESARAWADKYADALATAGADRDALLEETERRREVSRDRAASLFDRVVNDVPRRCHGTVLGA